MLINGQPIVGTTQEILQQLSELPSSFADDNRWTKDNFERGSTALNLYSEALSANSSIELEEISTKLPSLIKENPYTTFLHIIKLMKSIAN
ncbi:hypothetical protein [Rickettsia endosymbiont of Cantharis rufa]|uniref:hypothetical protein n=1 Tax=Rickettsia endosymbiont of Cantharis rufa TaxID=3066248 RepID=UPI003132E4CF